MPDLLVYHPGDIPTYLELARQDPSVKKLFVRWWPGWGATGFQYYYAGSTDRSISILEQALSFSFGKDDGGHYFSLAGKDDTTHLLSETFAVVAAPTTQTIAETNPYTLIRFSLTSVTNVRAFIGKAFSDWSVRSVIMDTDDENFQMSGLQFSTARPDTNFQFIHRDGSSGFGIIDTGVAAVVDKVYQLEQEWSGDGTSLRARLSDHTGAILWGDTTITTTLGSVTYGTSEMIVLKALANETKGFRINTVEEWI